MCGAGWGGGVGEIGKAEVTFYAGTDGCSENCVIVGCGSPQARCSCVGLGSGQNRVPD